MANLHKIYIYTFWATLFVSLCLIVGGFFVPPMGEIDGSVLTAVGEIFLFPTLALGAKALEDNKTITLRKGEMELKVSDKGKDEGDNEGGE